METRSSECMTGICVSMCYSHAQLMWLTRVRVLSELEVIVKDAELAFRDAKIAMLQRRLRVVKKQRRGRKLGKLSI